MRYWRWLGAGLLVALFSACRTIDLPAMDPSLPSLHVEDLLAPTASSATHEIDRLNKALPRIPRHQREQRAAVVLRIAVLQTRRGNLRDAERLVRRSIGGHPSSRPRAIGLAWFVQHRIDMARDRPVAARGALESAARYTFGPAARRRIASARAALTPRVVRPAPTKSTTPVAIVRRGSWGSAAARPRAMVPMEAPDRITVHHSAMWTSPDLVTTCKLVRSFQRYHMNQLGWGDIGYHYLIDRTGKVIEGRELRWQGAHAGDGIANQRNIGICLLGNFQPGTKERVQRPSTKQLYSLELLVTSLSDMHGIPVASVFTHAEVHPKGPGATKCPGMYLTPFVRQLRSRGTQ